jgi:Uma2 family endonuclease
MATTIERLTYDDLETIPLERDVDRQEIIDGELVVTPAPIPTHQIVSRSCFRRLDRHVVEHDLGEVFYAPVDIRFTPDNVLNPDIVFVAHDRLHIIGPKAIDGPPGLVVEIMSPGTRRRDLTVKRGPYARYGVREYWIVDPDRRTVVTLALVGDVYESLSPREDGSLQSRVFPDLRLSLDDLFEGISRRFAARVAPAHLEDSFSVCTDFCRGIDTRARPRPKPDPARHPGR